MRKPRPRPLRLLMIDDEQADVALFRTLFQRVAPDFHFQAALNGADALALLNTPDAPLPDLILLDVKMPGMDGHTVLTAIKANPALKHLTVVTLSNATQDEDVQRAYRGLASAYLAKPVHVEEGLELVRAFQGFWRLAYLPYARPFEDLGCLPQGDRRTRAVQGSIHSGYGSRKLCG